MFFLSLLFLLNSQSYDVVWYHQDIYIPLQEEVTHYTTLPYVEVYKDNKIVDNVDIYYQRGVERTFLSVLHSREVKSFYIKYRVYIPSIQYDEIVTISFHIVDDISPDITSQEEIKFAFNQKIDVLKALTIKDNYYAFDQLEIIIDYSKVDKSKVGFYLVQVKVKDPSNNRNTLDIWIEIYDNEAPEVSMIKKIMIEPNSSFNIFDYIKVKDNVDSFFNITVVDTYVNYNQIGNYPIWIHVDDQSGNRSTISHDVEIKDSLKPILILISKNPTIEVYEEITENLILSFVISFYDLFDVNPILTWVDDIDTTKIGTYTIYFRGSDASNNEVLSTLKVTVQDSQAPYIREIDPLIFDVFSQLKPLLTYFVIEDNYHDMEDLTIVIKGQINLQMIGLYELLFEISDPSKNKKTYRFYAEVLDREAPTLIEQEAIIISNFQKPNYNDLLVFKDQYDKKSDISIIVDDTQVNYLEIGHHELKVILIDASQNKSEYTIFVIIMDLYPPTITLKQMFVYIDVENFFFNAVDYIESIQDNQKELSMNDVRIQHQVIQEIGTYEVIYEISDQNGLFNEATLTVYVLDFGKPIVEAKNMLLKYGDAFDKENGIHIRDHSNFFLIHLNSLDVTKIGNQTLYYVVYDDNGNETFFSRVVTIQYSNIFHQLKPYYKTAIVFIIGSSFTFLLWYYYGRRVFDKNDAFEYNESVIENN